MEIDLAADVSLCLLADLDLVSCEFQDLVLPTLVFYLAFDI